MDIGTKRIALAALGATCIAGSMAVLQPSSALADCTPASIDPSCPLSPLDPSNAANPANINNPNNPASPLNPANQAPYAPRTVFNPGGILSGLYSGAGLCDLGDAVCPAPPSAAAAAPTEAYPVVRHRRHRKHTLVQR